MLLNLFVESWVGENVKMPYSTGQEVKEVIKEFVFFRWMNPFEKVHIGLTEVEQFLTHFSLVLRFI